MNQASRKSWLVPVLPAAGQPAIARALAGAGRQRLAAASRSSCRRSVGSTTWPGPGAGALVEHLAVGGRDALDDVRDDAAAAIGEGHEGAGQFERASPPRCRARSTASPCSGEAMPRRRAVAATAAGPTSAVSCAETVFSDSASAVCSVTGPRYSLRVVLRPPALDRHRLVDRAPSPGMRPLSSAVR